MEVFLFIALLPYSLAHPTLLKVPDCGLIGATGRIIGGVDASINQSPWYVQLTFDKYFCGGFLITPRHIMTAAHCGTAAAGYATTEQFVKSLKVKFGSSTPGDMHATQAVAARRHPRFNGHYYFNDIMIIDLGKEIKQTGVRPVCLVGESDKDHEVEGQMAAVFGLGKITDKRNAAMLQVTVQKILSRKQCANHPKLRENLYDPDLHICAYLSLTRKGRSDACEGDSGGALSIVRKYGSHGYRQFAVGIVSYGFNCALRNTPGIYTRISHYQKYIIKSVKELGGAKYLYE